jgi:hypothetical protein
VTRPARLLTLATTFADHQRAALASPRRRRPPHSPITGVTRPARLLTLATTFADHQRATLDSLR